MFCPLIPVPRQTADGHADVPGPAPGFPQMPHAVPLVGSPAVGPFMHPPQAYGAPTALPPMLSPFPSHAATGSPPTGFGMDHPLTHRSQAAGSRKLLPSDPQQVGVLSLPPG